MAQNNPYALSFDGVNDYAGPFAVDTNAYCIEMIFSTDYIINASLYRKGLFSFGDSRDRNNFYCYFGQGSTDFLGEVITFQNSDGPYRIVYARNFVIEPGLHHLALRYAGNANNGYQIILDGVILKTNYMSSIPDLVRAHDLYIGKAIHYGSEHTKISIDEFRIWGEPRTLEQIQENMYKTLTGTEPGLEFYLRFDTGAGNIAYDSSPNANHGTIYGATWIPGLVDLEGEDEPGEIVTASITFRGRSLMSLAGVKRATGSITFRGQSSMFLSAVKTAVGKITFRGTSTMSLIGLVLRELEGIYQISSSEIFSRNQPILSEDLANYIEVWINPMVPAATAEEIYRSKEAEAIPPGETKTFTVEFDEEPVIEATATLEEAGPNLSIITNETKYFGSTAEIAVYNSGTTEQTCIIVVNGKPLEVQGRRKIVVKDEESILDHGLVKYEFDSPLVQDEASARDIGQKILRLFSVARANIEITWRGDPAQELADICQIPEFEKLGVTKKENFYITRQQFVVADGGMDVSMAGRKVPKAEE